jgi:molybdopterin-guanine dinucleotide biosynthesis protein A
VKCSAIILSGGRGRRAGGADKGLLPWREGTRVSAVLAVLAPQVDQVVISCNRNLDAYGKLDATLVTDSLPGFQGPLAGLSAALESCHGETVVVAPCDCPTLPAELIPRLLAPLEDDALDLCFAHDGEREQYLFCALRKRTAGSLHDYLASGGRSVRGWFATLNSLAVDCSDLADRLSNLNTGDDPG